MSGFGPCRKLGSFSTKIGRFRPFPDPFCTLITHICTQMCTIIFLAYPTHFYMCTCTTSSCNTYAHQNIPPKSTFSKSQKWPQNPQNPLNRPFPRSMAQEIKRSNLHNNFTKTDHFHALSSVMLLAQCSWHNTVQHYVQPITMLMSMSTCQLHLPDTSRLCP